MFSRAKSLSLVFKNHILKELTDGYFLFTIGTTEISVATEEEAIAIARNPVKDFMWTADGVGVLDFNVLQEPVSPHFHPNLRKEGWHYFPTGKSLFILTKITHVGLTALWLQNGRTLENCEGSEL